MHARISPDPDFRSPSRPPAVETDRQLSDAKQEVIGVKEVGLVEYRFEPDGFEVLHVRAPVQIDVGLDSLIGEAATS